MWNANACIVLKSIPSDARWDVEHNWVENPSEVGFSFSKFQTFGAIVVPYALGSLKKFLHQKKFQHIVVSFQALNVTKHHKYEEMYEYLCIKKTCVIKSVRGSRNH